jgi:type I restriction enzyme, S subunit
MSRVKKVPNGWKPTRIKDAAQVNPRSNSVDDDTLVTFLPMNAVSESGGIRGDEIRKAIEVKKGFTSFETGDVLVAKITPCFENYKGCLCTELKNDRGYGSTEFHVLRPKKNITAEYLHILTRTHHFRGTGELNMTGTAGQKRVPTIYLKNYDFLLPPLPEQKAIAALLATWDEAIEKTERLIQANERQKLGELHSRISSQKANSTIGAFAKPVVRKVDKPEESYVAVGIRSHFKGTFQRLVEDPRTVNMDSLYRVKENDLILNITFAWEGAIALVKKEDEECYVSHRFPTYEIKRSKAEPCFIRQLIMSSRMKYDLSNISPGGAGRNRVLNKKDFLKMPIWLPDLETQKNIGEYLGAIDKEIDLLKQLAEKYKTQKRGLMQKMLTGEWRIKPEIVNQYMEA